MVELSENIPFLWRLSSHNEEGFCLVSMVVPFNSGNESLEHTIETDVVSFNSDDYSMQDEEILEWNEDDIELFLRLIANTTTNRALGTETIKVDLTDPETIEIVQIVAAAGFGLALPAEEFLISTNSIQLDFKCEPGTAVSLYTSNGYKRCIVADVDEEEVVCVMLDRVESSSIERLDGISPHDLILVKKHQLLHPSYSSSMPSQTDILH